MSAEATTAGVAGGATPAAAQAVAPASDRAHAKPPLDDVMLAMDVVDTLRRRDRLVKQELDLTGREEDLKERLRKIYAAQGIEVPDHVIEQGVAALKEERFVYKPPPEGLTTRLARLYVSRSRWGKWAAGAVAAPFIAWGGHWFAVGLPNAALPEDLVRVHAEVVALAKTDDARQAAAQGLDAGQAALRAEDTDAARKALRQLDDLRVVLDQEYTLRIVNRSGERSGVYRVPDLNTAAANYYIVVEGIGATGEPVRVPVKSEENGTTERVTQWGLRVDQATYNAVGRDKADDGIIERDRFGAKRRGYLTPDYEMKTTGGAITRW
jgi:hypothetical protein